MSMELPQALTAFEWLADAIDGEIWTYPAIAVAFDSLLPVAPGETVMIAAGVPAAGDDLSCCLSSAPARPEAFSATTFPTALAHRWGGAPSAGSSPRQRRANGWRGRRQLRERGAVIVLVARFVPGGRTATTFSAGALDMPWHRFLMIDTIAAALWSAAYMYLLGYFGGAAFEESLWKPLLATGVVAAAVAAGAELLRRARLS